MHTDAKNATRKSVIFLKRLGFVSLVWRAASKLSDQWDWCFCSRVWSCWSYSKTQLGGAQTQKQSCRAHIRNDEEDKRQVASTLPASASFLIQQNNNFFIAGAAGASGAWNIHVFFVWFWQACKYLLSSSSEWQASVRSVKLRSATLCTGVFLFYIKRHLMSGNEFACSLGSSSAKIAWVWTQKTLANNQYSSRCVRAFRLCSHLAYLLKLPASVLRRKPCFHKSPERFLKRHHRVFFCSSERLFKLKKVKLFNKKKKSPTSSTFCQLSNDKSGESFPYQDNDSR